MAHPIETGLGESDAGVHRLGLLAGTEVTYFTGWIVVPF